MEKFKPGDLVILSQKGRDIGVEHIRPIDKKIYVYSMTKPVVVQSCIRDLVSCEHEDFPDAMYRLDAENFELYVDSPKMEDVVAMLCG